MKNYWRSIKLDRREVQAAQLSTEVGAEPLLGWNTPLGAPPNDADIAPTEILVSKHTLPSDAGLPTAV